MDTAFDGFDDFHLHLNPSSSVLKELASLIPPSPILDAFDLPESFTSADIPIILFDDTTGGLDGDTLDTPLAPLDPSESVQTIGSIGTFGPRRNHHHRPPPILPSLSPIQAVSVDSPPISPVDTVYSEMDGDTSSLSEMSVASFHTALSTVESQTSISSARSAPAPGKPRSFHLNRHPSTLFSGTPSPLSANFPSSNSNYSSYSCPSSPRSCTSRSPSPSYDSDNQSLYADSPNPLLDRSHRSTSQSSLTRHSHVHRHSTRENKHLPDSLSWLKDTTVNLLIDQEGFRSVNPAFKFAGYSSRSKWLDPQDGVADAGVAEFMPKKRLAFHFHYAPFDGLPILRRVTTNQDDAHDHISRQASISLKSNGIYTIRGSEASSLDGSDGVKLRWKFDYMVDDRKVEGTGKFVDGEKTLTPLTFSCSPLLLHPQQGKKIRLMHIVKKSVVAKLVAERVEPPGAQMRTPSPLSSPVPSPKKPASGTKNHPAISRVWNMHRRAQSQTPARDQKHRREPSHSPAISDIDEYVHVSPHAEGTSPRRRRRRASSAAHEGVGWALENILNTEIARQPSSLPASPLIKHIIPPSHFIVSTPTRH